MATVIGQDPNFTANCGNCGAVVRYTREDLVPDEKITDADSSDYGDYRCKVPCPKCGRGMPVRQIMSAQEAEAMRRDDI